MHTPSHPPSSPKMKSCHADPFQSSILGDSISISNDFKRLLGRVHKRVFISPVPLSQTRWNKPNFAPQKSHAMNSYDGECVSSPRQHLWRGLHILSIGTSVHFQLSCSPLQLYSICRATQYLSLSLMKIYVTALMHVELHGNTLRTVQTTSRPISSPAFPAPSPPLASLGYLRVTWRPRP